MILKDCLDSPVDCFTVTIVNFEPILFLFSVATQSFGLQISSHKVLSM